MSDKLQGGSALCLLILLSVPFFRKPSYEIFLRTHQAVASLVVYSIAQHLIFQSDFNWSYVYIFFRGYSPHCSPFNAAS